MMGSSCACKYFVNGKTFSFEHPCIDNKFERKTSVFVSLAIISFRTVFGSHIFFQFICFTIHQWQNFVGVFNNVYSGCQAGNVRSSRTSFYKFFMIVLYCLEDA